MNAVDYLLKPVEKARLREAINRAQERIEHAEIVAEQGARVGAAVTAYESARRAPPLERIPVRKRDEVLIVPVSQIAAIVADGQLLHLTTVKGERHSHHLSAEGSRGPARAWSVSSALGAGRSRTSTASSRSMRCPAGRTWLCCRTVRSSRSAVCSRAPSAIAC